MANVGTVTSTNGASTEIIDANGRKYNSIYILNTGADTCWLTWGATAAVDQGTRILAGAELIWDLSQGNFPEVLNSWADGSNCDLIYQYMVK